ncbi:hypothetical protein PWY87_16270 [Kribbella solani]|uniref:hypothetical protein n=1 Tax=Kribbella solani TaxID=236067 RepID=UPI00299FF9D7|nr:hypothetical protein [Kribbella solani]MDX3003247.1 hypothetical protein [Kribbella solani]
MSIQSTNPVASNQYSQQLASTMTNQSSDPTLQQQPVGSSRSKELGLHLGITIKWSLDSASRRRIGLPPSAAVGAVAPVSAGGAAWLF